jgi:hypothetical protein
MRPSGIATSGSRRTRNRAQRISDGEELSWWQRAVFYEIAAISFQDSNGDGKGDLAGLLPRVDPPHLARSSKSRIEPNNGSTLQ